MKAKKWRENHLDSDTKEFFWRDESKVDDFTQETTEQLRISHEVTMSELETTFNNALKVRKYAISQLNKQLKTEKQILKDSNQLHHNKIKDLYTEKQMDNAYDKGVKDALQEAIKQVKKI